ncbi:SMI1/KNR4 family protein [Calothrix sp. NIES-2098]|uniref:SMI1/KNR4 family protein n=1 Tax=Calothrix sp. NIES-2098 TaxID=1954171 RepID=UPI000B5EBE61|nr:hypothetical protein NIES2098_62310 [Calothrix sp. NIES-2098]
MASEDLKKWKFLLAKLEVILQCTRSLSTLNAIQLLDFESRSCLVLPEGYKEFCQVIGSGRFGQNMFFIEVPDIENSEEQLLSNEIIIDACKDSYQWSTEIQELLKHAYLFGGGDFYVSFIFDLRTYSQQDKSYDIYGVSCQTGFSCYLGRDFFEFVCEICVGERAKKDFPELLVGVPKNFDRDNPVYRSKTFVPFPIFQKDIALLEDDG